jgi:hypothetical protein
MGRSSTNGLTIITNNVPRDVLDWHDLTPNDRAEFDYLDTVALDEGRDSASFVRYHSELYDLGEFSADYGITRGTGLPDRFAGWHGYLADSFYSGLLIRYLDSHEQVILARWLT